MSVADDKVDEVYRLLGLHPDTAWETAMEELLAARAGNRHYADLAVKLDDLNVRSANVVKTLRDWRTATETALTQGLNAVGAEELVTLLDLIIRNFESGSLLPLTTGLTCAACGRVTEDCECPRPVGGGTKGGRDGH